MIKRKNPFVPKWWNGRRGGLKIHYGRPYAGSSPAFGTN